MKRFKFISVFLLTSLILLTSVFFTGCENGSAQTSTKLPAAPSRTYSSSELHTFMFTKGIINSIVIMADKNYVLTTRGWIESEFSSGLSAFQFQMGMNRWIAESNDCDKFSSATSFYAKWLNHSTPNRKVNASLACGEVYFIQDRSQSGHAINFFIVTESGNLTILFYEPQTRLFVTLSETETSSIFFWKL